MSIDSMVAHDNQRGVTHDQRSSEPPRVAGRPNCRQFPVECDGIAWQITRLLIVAILMFVEPIVGFVLCGLALVGVIVSVILKFSGAAPSFPFWPALGMSVGLYVAFVIYVAEVRSLVPQPREE
jgi:hypothetical protein